MSFEPLAMLSPDDWALMQVHMRTRQVVPGDVLIREGVRHRALFIVRDGLVRVERDIRGRAIVLSQLGPGQVLGEIGFAEDGPASASVVAQEPSRLDVIDGDALQGMISGDPRFASRFFHSLARSLAQRTRAADTARLASNGPAHATASLHRPRTGNLSLRQIPPELVAGVEAFERAMLDARLALRAQRPSDFVERQVADACDAVVALMARLSGEDRLVDMGYSDLLAFRDPDQLEDGVGDFVFRETFSLFMQSATMARCHAKPRGFAEDFETLRMIRRNEAEGDDRLGPLIDRWFLNRPICRSRRSTAVQLGIVLDDVARGAAGRTPLRVADLASGSADDLIATLSQGRSGAWTATCVDLDADALVEGSFQAQSVGLTDHAFFVQANAVPATGTELTLGRQDLVVAFGLLDYLSDDDGVSLLDAAHALLVPSGCMVVSQLASGHPDEPLMEHLLDWPTHTRDEAQLAALFARSRLGVDGLQIKLDGPGVTWYARAVRRV